MLSCQIFAQGMPPNTSLVFVGWSIPCCPLLLLYRDYQVFLSCSAAAHTHTHTRARTHARSQNPTHTYHVYTYIYIHIDTYTYTYIFLSTRARTRSGEVWGGFNGQVSLGAHTSTRKYSLLLDTSCNWPSGLLLFLVPLAGVH